jgi:hypothetical protein
MTEQPVEASPPKPEPIEADEFKPEPDFIPLARGQKVVSASESQVRQYQHQLLGFSTGAYNGAMDYRSVVGRPLLDSEQVMLRAARRLYRSVLVVLLEVEK